MRVTREHGRAVVDVSLLEANGAFRNGETLELEVTDPSARRATIPVPQIGPGADRAPASTPLWPYLASLAAVLWLADLALRRIRLSEGVEGTGTRPRG